MDGVRYPQITRSMPQFILDQFFKLVSLKRFNVHTVSQVLDFSSNSFAVMVEQRRKHLMYRAKGIPGIVSNNTGRVGMYASS